MVEMRGKKKKKKKKKKKVANEKRIVWRGSMDRWDGQREKEKRGAGVRGCEGKKEKKKKRGRRITWQAGLETVAYKKNVFCSLPH
jgi:hypothetical protein